MSNTCRFVFLATILICAHLSFAQDRADDKVQVVADKYWSVDLGIGMILMPHGTSSPLMGKRPALGFQQRFAVNYAFATQWAVYGGFGYNYYGNRRPEILDPARIGIHREDILEGLFGKFENIKPTFDAGMMYRFQMRKWDILPKLGLSYTVNDWGRDRQLTLKENGLKINYRMKAAVPGMQLGLNSHYWVSQKGYLHFSVLAEHPLQKPYGEATYYRGAEQMNRIKVKSAAFGQNLYAQIGYGFAFGES